MTPEDLTPSSTDMTEPEVLQVMENMVPMQSQCRDCPWSEVENRADMAKLFDDGEKLWPCHHTATIDEDENGRVTYIVEEPRNRVCFGYQEFVRNGNCLPIL